MYTEAKFDGAIQRLTQCLDAGQFSVIDQQKAYHLIGLSYIGTQLMDQARQAVEELLTIAPNYQPDPIYDPPAWDQLVTEVKTTMSTGDVSGETASGETASGETASNSYTMGVSDGRRAGEGVPTGKYFVGGLIGGVGLGVIGTGISVAITASRDAPVPPSQVATLQAQGANYYTGYQQGYAKKVKSKRTVSSLVGGLAGTAVIVAVLVATSSQ
jgi:hypothetical protein